MEPKQISRILAQAYQNATANLSQNQKKMIPLIVILLLSGTVIGGYSLIHYLTQTTVDVSIQYVDNPYQITLYGDASLSTELTSTSTIVNFITEDPSETFSDSEWIYGWIEADYKVWEPGDYILVDITAPDLLADEGIFEMEYTTTAGEWAKSSDPEKPGLVSLREDIHPRQVRIRLFNVPEPDPQEGGTFDFTLLLESLEDDFVIDAFDLPIVSEDALVSVTATDTTLVTSTSIEYLLDGRILVCLTIDQTVVQPVKMTVSALNYAQEIISASALSTFTCQATYDDGSKAQVRSVSFGINDPLTCIIDLDPPGIITNIDFNFDSPGLDAECNELSVLITDP